MSANNFFPESKRYISAFSGSEKQACLQAGVSTGKRRQSKRRTDRQEFNRLSKVYMPIQKELSAGARRAARERLKALLHVYYEATGHYPTTDEVVEQWKQIVGIYVRTNGHRRS